MSMDLSQLHITFERNKKNYNYNSIRDRMNLLTVNFFLSIGNIRTDFHAKEKPKTTVLGLGGFK